MAIELVFSLLTGAVLVGLLMWALSLVVAQLRYMESKRREGE